MSSPLKSIRRKSYEDFVDDVLFVEKGPHKGRICYCDDVDRSILFISFGHYLSVADLYQIPARNARLCTMGDLISRYEELREIVYANSWVHDGKNAIDDREMVVAMHELMLAQDEIMDRDHVARYGATSDGKKVYLAHSSVDKGFVRRVHADLKALGHDPWLDEYKISVGESIVDRIQTGIEQSDFMILFLSNNALESIWAKAEWQTKFWEEIATGNAKILVALLDQCGLPPLLKTKKYADFTKSYNDALVGLLQAIGHNPRTKSDSLSI